MHAGQIKRTALQSNPLEAKLNIANDKLEASEATVAELRAARSPYDVIIQTAVEVCIQYFKPKAIFLIRLLDKNVLKIIVHNTPCDVRNATAGLYM